MAKFKHLKNLCFVTFLTLLPLQAMGVRRSAQPTPAQEIEVVDGRVVIDLTHLTPSRGHHSFPEVEAEESSDWLAWLRQPFSWCTQNLSAAGFSLCRSFRRNRVPILLVVSKTAKIYSLFMILESRGDHQVIPFLQDYSGVHRFSESRLTFTHQHLAMIEMVLRLMEQFREERHSGILSRQIAEIVVRFYQLYGYSQIIRLPLPEALSAAADRLIRNSVCTSAAISVEIAIDYFLQREIELQLE